MCRPSSELLPWLLAQTLAFLFLFAFSKQFLPLSPKQMLQPVTLCLTPKTGIWLHRNCQLVLDLQLGKLKGGAPWQATETLGIQHHISCHVVMILGKGGRLPTQACQFLAFTGFLLGVLLLPSPASNLNGQRRERHGH